MTDNDFLEAIVANPTDDVPRQIYADWLEEHGENERAEFIRIQCELAELEPADPRRRELEPRQLELLRYLKAEWTWQLKGIATSCWMERGFVERIVITPDAFSEFHERIFKENPILEIRFDFFQDSAQALTQLADCPGLAQIRGLSLEGIRLHNFEPAAQTLLYSDHLAKMVSLDLKDCNLLESGVRVLLNSPRLTNLRKLILENNDVTDVEMLMLIASTFSTLERLNLSGTNVTDKGLRLLAERAPFQGLRSLGLAANDSDHHSGRTGQITDEGIRHLANSSKLHSLVSLDLKCQPVGDTGLQILLGEGTVFRLRHLHLKLYDWTPPPSLQPITDQGAAVLEN